MIRIPFLSRSADGAALQRVLDMTAERSGVGVEQVAIAMSLLLEGIADELTKGRCVRIPGFGTFVPEPIPERHRKMSRNPRPRCKPLFLPSRGFKAQVAMGLGPLPENLTKIRRHEKNHAGTSEDRGHRVFTAMAAFRRQISSQLSTTGQ